MHKEYLREDEWYLDFDDKIQNLVKALHSFGIETIWCCEGHIRTERFFTGVLPWPYVIVICTLKEIQKLETAIGKWNDSMPSYRWMLSQRRIHGSLTPDYLSYTYLGIVRALVPVEENNELSAEVLMELQESANEFANFLRET